MPGEIKGVKYLRNNKARREQKAGQRARAPSSSCWIRCEAGPGGHPHLRGADRGRGFGDRTLMLWGTGRAWGTPSPSGSVSFVVGSSVVCVVSEEICVPVVCLRALRAGRGLAAPAMNVLPCPQPSLHSWEQRSRQERALARQAGAAGCVVMGGACWEGFGHWGLIMQMNNVLLGCTQHSAGTQHPSVPPRLRPGS